MSTIRIQMMDDFAIYIDEIQKEHMVKQSKKGLALMHYLMIHRGQSVPNHKLLQALWPEEKNTNPENALKTLVSRLRVQLNQLSPDFGKCIVADRGAYHWQCMDGMTIDLYEIDRILEELAADTPVGRNGTPEDVAKAMEYVMQATFVTGQVIPVNGGYVI